MCDKLSKCKIPTSKEDENFFVNTSIITRRSFLPFVKGYSKKWTQSWSSASEWYPRANIYYPFVEDTNPITRLKDLDKLISDSSENHVFQPHFSPPENPFTTRDPYSENEAKNKYLRTQPVCFTIFGKPGLNTNKLAKMIATSQNCVLISPENQIKEEIEKNSEKGQYIANILKSGESIGQEIILNLIEERINQRDVMHRGYVIEGLPLIPNDFNLDYSSYPEHVHIPEDSNNKEKFTTSPASSYLDFIESKEEDIRVFEDSLDDLVNSKQRIRECYECDIPRQIEEMFSIWPLKPQIIIYAVCPDTDLLQKRCQYFWDPHSDKIHEMIGDNEINELDMVKAFKRVLEEESINENTQKHFVKRIIDMNPNILFQTEIYQRYILPTIDKIILKHNPQNVIRVDGRTSPEEMFQIVSLKLRILPLPRVIIPEKLSQAESFQIRGEDYEEELVVNPNQNLEGKTKEEIFKELSKRGTVSPRFRWRLSNWKFYCPVELAKGRKVLGDFNHAIHFMNSLYFLSSQEAENSFIENPRTYLLPPNPRPTCKIAIIGPRHCGKTDLSNKLALSLGGTVIDIQKLEGELIEEQMQEKIAIELRKILDIVIKDAAEILEKERKEREKKRLEELKNWSLKVKQLLNRLQILKSSQGSSEEIENIRQTLREYDIQFLEDDEDLQIIDQDESMIEAYAPDYLKNEEQRIPTLTEHDPEVAIMLEDRLRFLRDKPINISPEDKVKMIIRNIEIVSSGLAQELERDDGWILDNMYLDPVIWIGLIESGLEIEDVIVLFEKAPYDYLIKNWCQLNDCEEVYEEYDDGDHLSANIETGSNNFNEGNGENTDNYTKNSELMTLSEYIKSIKEFEKNLKIFQDKFEEWGKEAFFCNLNTDLLKTVSEHLYKEYQLVGSKMSEEEREEEIMDVGYYFLKDPENLEEEEKEEDYEMEGEEEEEEEEEEYVKLEVPADNRRLGDTSIYCPIALMRHRVLWKGQENLSALFGNRIYLLSNEKALNEFVQNSIDFSLPWKEPLCKIPPIRICIVGTPGSGKSTMANAISKECGLARIDFFDKIDDYMVELGRGRVGWKHEASINIKDKDIPESEQDNEENLKTSDDQKSEDQEPDDLKFDDQKSLFHKDSTQSVVKNYIKSGGTLPDPILKETFFKYFEPPFDECGIIFDSFPNCTQDVEIMLTNYAVPEIIIELRCSLESAEERLLPYLLDSWRAKENQKKLEEQIRFKKELKVFNLLKKKWMKERLRKRRRRRQKGFFEEDFYESDEESLHTPPPSLISENESLLSKKTTELELKESSSEDFNLSSQEAIDRIELEELYLKNNAEPKPFSDWEDENVVKERISRNIKEAYESSNQNLRKTRDRMKVESIPWIEINSEKEVVHIFCHLLTILDPYLHRNSSVLERTYEISIDTAEELLDSGYYLFSSFGRNCPVQIYERKIPFHMFLSMEAQGQIFPVLHRQYVYFLSGKEAVESFKKDPLKYLNQDSCSPLIPVQISILGPPKCGKTNLAQRFARTYGLKIITRGQSLRHTLKKFTWTDVSQSIEKNLQEGNVVADKQVARAVDLYSFHPESESLGYILDGFPVSQSEAEELILLGIKPMIVIDLEAHMEFCLECLEYGAQEIKKPSIFSSEFLTHQYQIWQLDEKLFRDWLSGFAANIVKIDATKCKSGVWKRANEAICSRFSAIKKYFREADYEKIHHLQDLCVSPYEFKKRESIYQTYCPVCINLDNILKSSSIPLDRKGVFQFRNHFYWICSKHVDIFANDPLENLKKELPNDRPQILDQTIDVEHTCWAKRLKASGYCLVTYVESLPYQKFVAGKPDLALLFKDRLYLFCTIECRDRFMERSSDYSEVEINFHKTLPPIEVKNLPNLGFLEQTVASLIIKGVNYLGILRPKLMGLSASATAAIYLGAYLKTHNLTCDLNEVSIYEDVIKRMEDRSKTFQVVIHNMKNKVNPFVTLINEKWIKRERSTDTDSLEEDNLEDIKSVDMSKSSYVSKQSSSVKFRRTSPSQLLSDTESIINTISSI